VLVMVVVMVVVLVWSCLQKKRSRSQPHY